MWERINFEKKMLATFWQFWVHGRGVDGFSLFLVGTAIKWFGDHTAIVEQFHREI